MGRAVLHSIVFLLVILAIMPLGGGRAPLLSHAQQVPADLEAAVAQFVQTFETFDAKKVLELYTDDFISGTGRSKHELRRALLTLRANHVVLKVEHTEITEVKPTEARLSAHLRLRYKDRFRGLDGEVAVTDVILYSLRKEADRWKIYTDERLATDRDGHFGSQPPSVALEVPQKLSTALRYSVKVSVQREPAKSYQVILGNYVDDILDLPPPEVVTRLPEDGILQTRLSANPDGFSEVVRATVVATDQGGAVVGATMVSKFIHGALQNKPATPQQAA